MNFLKRVHLHPFLMGMFPVISLYAHNQSQLELGAPLRSLVIVLGATAIVFVLLRWLFGDFTRAGFITTFISFLFFVYGPIKNIIILHNIHFAGVPLGSGRYLLPLFLVFLIIGIWLLAWKIPHGETSLLIFNGIALSALIFPIISITSYAIFNSTVSIKKQPRTVISQSLSTQPDIYYIILDMYTRSDTIESEFGYDNSAFLEALRKQGFYVAACSTSNYSHTQLSMASSLNMNYLSALGDGFVAGNTDYSGTTELIKNNAVRQYLHQYGYAFVSFQSRFPFLNITDSDVFISMPNQSKFIQPFEMLLIEQTPGTIILNEMEKIARTLKIGDIRLYGSQYDTTLFTLDTLTRLPTSIPGPKFVYAHLLIPHPEYVFGPNGEYTGDDERFIGGPNHDPINQAAYKLGYTNQVEYIDSRIPKIVEQIISRSKVPPVIIIQGDHGVKGTAQKNMPILNAYYFPETEAHKLLYPTITPVNTFRLVLNSYFQGHFELLPDLSYYSKNYKDYYNVTLYDNKAIGCRPK